MNLRHPIELVITDKYQKQLLNEQAAIDFNTAKDYATNKKSIVMRYKDGKCYLVNPFDDLDQLSGDVGDYSFYHCPEINDYMERRLIRPIVDVSARDDLIVFNSTIIWRMASNAVADKIDVDSNFGLRDILENPVNVWNATAQIGFPLIYGLATGIVRAIAAVNSFEKQHGRPMTEIEKKAAYKDCAAYSAKTVIASGAGELGYFIGQCVITICSMSPFSAWIPATLAIGCGLLRGIFSIVNQIAEEKQKFGEVRSSYMDLRKTFFNNFVGGSIGLLVGYIPFVPLLATAVIKPVAQIVGSILTVAAAYISNKITRYFAPLVAERADFLWGGMSSFFKKDVPGEIELQPLKMRRDAVVDVAKAPLPPVVSSVMLRPARKKGG